MCLHSTFCFVLLNWSMDGPQGYLSSMIHPFCLPFIQDPESQKAKLPPGQLQSGLFGLFGLFHLHAPDSRLVHVPTSLLGIFYSTCYLISTGALEDTYQVTGSYFLLQTTSSHYCLHPSSFLLFFPPKFDYIYPIAFTFVIFLFCCVELYMTI